MDSKWLLIKVVGHKRCNDWLHRFCFTPLGITYGFHWVNHYVCSVWGILIFKVGRLSTIQVRGFTYLPLWRKDATNCLPRKQNYNPLLHSEKNIAQIPRHYFWAESAYFHRFPQFYFYVIAVGRLPRHPVFSVLMNVNLAPSFYPESPGAALFARDIQDCTSIISPN